MDEKLLDLIIHPNQEVMFLNRDFVHAKLIRGLRFRQLFIEQPHLVRWEHEVRAEVISNYFTQYSKAANRRGQGSVEAWMLAEESLDEFLIFKAIGKPVDHEDYSFMVRNQIVAYRSHMEYFESEFIHSFSDEIMRGDGHFWAVWGIDNDQFIHSDRLAEGIGSREMDTAALKNAFFKALPEGFTQRIAASEGRDKHGRVEIQVDHDTVETVFAVNYYYMMSNLPSRYYLFIIRPIVVRPKKIPFTADLYKAVINTAAIDLTVFDTDHRYLFINENAVRDTEIRHWLIGKTDFDYCALRGLDTSLAVRRREKFTECITTRKTIELEEKFVNQHGEARYSIKRFKPIVYKDEVRYVIGFGLDITELKVYENYLEQSEKKYRDLFESSLDLIQSVDINGKLLFYNRAWEERMGYSKEDIDNLNLFDIIVDEDKEHCSELFQRVLMGESHHGVRVSFVTKTGNRILLEGNVVPRYEDGKVVATHAFFRDITERIEKELLLKQSLAEKESLLGEIHHRVKNNLTVVYSLLELQSMKETNDKILRVFKESQTRIKAMALVHEKLYRSNSFSRIELKNYLSDLTTFIVKAIEGNRLNVRVKLSGDPVFLDIRYAVPCGLLMNEIITNACKYAFPNVEEPTLSIITKTYDTYAIVIISDNGPGLSAEFNPSQSASLGMRLIKTFVNQLKGELKMSNDMGLKYEIKIPSK